MSIGRVIFWCVSSLLLISALVASVTFYHVYRKLGRPTGVRYESIRAEGWKRLLKANPKRHFLQTTDGQIIDAVLIERPDPEYVVVIAHGRWQAKEMLADFVEIFDEQTLVFFDFRAHGGSSGNVLSFGYCETFDVEAMLTFLRSHPATRSLPIIGIGLSMGGAALLRTQALMGGFAALVLDSVFSRLDIAISRQEAEVGIAPLLQPLAEWFFAQLLGIELTTVDPVCWIQHVDIPLLIIASVNDPLVPVDDAYELYAAAPHATLWVLPQAGHARARKTVPIHYKKKVKQLVQQVLPVSSLTK